MNQQQTYQQTQQPFIPGGYRQTSVYDGKRMRKAVVRRTIDHGAGIIRMLEDAGQPERPICRAPWASILPEAAFVINLLPPVAFPGCPLNAATTKFVHMSLNKVRCPINVAKWTPDAKRIITGAASGEFTLWNGNSFNFETILQAHDTAIRAMNWSHDGNYLVTGDHSGTLKIWQPSLNNIKAISAHKEPIRQVTFSPNDSKFASCSDDGAIKIWDFGEAFEERAITGHGWDVKTVDWHPYRSLLASGSKDNLIKLWDPKSGNNLATIHGHKNTVLDLKWNRNGHWLISSSKDQVIKMHDLRMLRELRSFNAAHKKEINTLAWHPVHEELFASGGAEGAIYFWLAGIDQQVGVVESAHDGIVWSLDWNPLGHVLVSASSDFSIRFWTRPRPGESGLDRFTLGRQAAEMMGIKATNAGEANQPQNEMFTVAEDEQLPGLGRSTFMHNNNNPNTAMFPPPPPPPSIVDPRMMMLHQHHQQQPQQQQQQRNYQYYNHHNNDRRDPRRNNN